MTKKNKPIGSLSAANKESILNEEKERMDELLKQAENLPLLQQNIIDRFRLILKELKSIDNLGQILYNITQTTNSIDNADLPDHGIYLGLIEKDEEDNREDFPHIARDFCLCIIKNGVAVIHPIFHSGNSDFSTMQTKYQHTTVPLPFLAIFWNIERGLQDQLLFLMELARQEIIKFWCAKEVRIMTLAREISIMRQLTSKHQTVQSFKVRDGFAKIPFDAIQQIDLTYRSLVDIRLSIEELTFLIGLNDENTWKCYV